MRAASELIAIACAAIAFRSIISLNSFSGHNKAPMHGDYEAQRHWQEVTVNLDATQWYQNSSDNDLLYWGLDYPPLTAYHSYLLGQVARHINSSYVELHTSRGIETKEHKSFMRLTVLAADAFIYVPGILVLCFCMDRAFGSDCRNYLFILFAIYPGQVLIDNGHFQYNNISLGLAAAAIAAILCNRNFLGAFLFTLALNYKQMELYHALPFFAYLLGISVSKRSFRLFASTLMVIAGIVLSTFAVLWLPWLTSTDAVSQVIRRIFPIGRGVFEDKVANFWCSFNVIFKLKKHFPNHQMALISLGVTLLAALPANIHLFCQRSKNSFILALFNTAASFFLFSFQVHEKSILLIALPAMCLFNWWPSEMLWFLKVSVFSMIPLLKRDDLIVPTVASLIIFHLTFKCKYFKFNKESKAQTISDALMILILIGFLTIKPPSRLPDIWALIISVVSCAHFVLFLSWGYSRQFCPNVKDIIKKE
ncbi:hypothetical protein KR222_002371 [Zaprionus bogoriensis]|nr:hypothetical protein KR222_002371 [Zaprionus bogoriensis]